jgi:hypothetical protein
MKFSLTPSDIITIINTIASLITSIVAITISVKALKQNSKMIEYSTRPQIQIYPSFLDGILYLIIKNFGVSEAYIDEITCSHSFTSKETMGDDLGSNIFSKINGSILSSGYSIKCPLLGYEIADETFDFCIRYHSPLKAYEENFSFNPITNIPFADMSPSSKTTDGHLLNISKQLHNLVKTKL